MGKVSASALRGLPHGRKARGGGPLAGGPRAALAIFALVALGAGMGLLIPAAKDLSGDVAVELRYAALADDAGSGAESAARSLPEGAAAWLRVAGTSIDYPVAQATEAAPEYFLSHDLWGEDASAGCPYLDYRCRASGVRSLVYAHRLGTTNKQFSPIAGTWQQAEFDRIGTLSWTTPAGNERLQPLCALKVDKTYQPVQLFGEPSPEELRAWLAEMLADSSARAANASELAKTAQKAITLATCSSEQSGQRDRTLLVFVAAS